MVVYIRRYKIYPIHHVPTRKRSHSVDLKRAGSGNEINSKDETAAHGCYCPADVAGHMRKMLATLRRCVVCPLLDVFI